MGKQKLQLPRKIVSNDICSAPVARVSHQIKGAEEKIKENILEMCKMRCDGMNQKTVTILILIR